MPAEGRGDNPGKPLILEVAGRNKTKNHNHFRYEAKGFIKRTKQFSFKEHDWAKSLGAFNFVKYVSVINALQRIFKFTIIKCSTQ